MSGTTTNQRLKDWVSEWAAVMQPADIYWCDGSADEYEQLCQQLVDSGTFTKLDEAKRPNSYWAHSDPGDVARVEDRTYICAANEDDAGPNNNWRDPAEMRAEMRQPLHRLDEGPNDVRRALLDGPARLADRPHRRPADRLGVRRGQHADHDPHGPGSARRPRQRRLGALPAFGRRPARRRRQGRALAVRRREQVHRALPGDPRDLVVRIRLRRQRTARQEVLRAAHRLGDGTRRRLAGRAHADPQAHEPRRRVEVHRRRFPVGVRQDQPGDARADDSGLEGRDDR